MEEIKKETVEQESVVKPINAFNDGDKNLNKKVTRKEVIEVFQQIMDNMNLISDYLMKDVNTMYSKQVFPFQIQFAVLKDILVEQGIVTEEEITKRYNEKIQKLVEKAREIKEENGEARLATKEEDEESEKKKIIQVVSRNKEESK